MQELFRDAGTKVTIDVYAQAFNPQKCEEQSKPVRIVPKNGFSALNGP